MQYLSLLLAVSEGDGDPMAFNPLAAITGITVFLVSLAVLYWKVWPVITKGLDDRNEKILAEIKAAQDAREQAKSALADYELERSRAREESSKMIAEAREQAKQLSEELREKNEKELTERMARATSDIEAAKAAAVVEIHTEAATLAAAMAGKILRREITLKDQKRLVEESLAELGGRN